MAVVIANQLGITVWYNSDNQSVIPSGVVEPSSTYAINPPSQMAPQTLYFWSSSSSTPDASMGSTTVHDNQTVTIHITTR